MQWIRGDEKSREKRECGSADRGREGGIMKSSGSLVEEATTPASQHSLALYRWQHAGIRSVRSQIRKWMFF